MKIIRNKKVKKNKKHYQLITECSRYQVDALQLSRVGQKRIGAGVQDLVTNLHQLTALKREKHTFTYWEETPVHTAKNTSFKAQWNKRFIRWIYE